MGKLFIKSIFHIFFIILMISNILEAKEEKNILLLSSYHTSLPWTKDYTRGVNKYINKQNIYKVNFFEEYMDVLRLKSSLNEKLWVNYLKDKYKNVKIDAVLVDSTYITNFQYKYTDKIFGEIPIIMFENKVFTEKKEDNYYFFENKIDKAIDKTIELAISQFPKRKKIVVIANNKKESQKILNIIKNNFAQYNNYKVELLLDLSLKQYKEELKKLSKDTILFYTLITKDEKGNPVIPKKVINEIAEVSTVPIYTFYSTLIGTGVIGGNLLDGETIGYSMVEAAFDFLKNGKYKSTYESNENIFDFNIINKFHIQESSLPKDSVLINKKLSLYEIYEKEIFILVLSLIFIIILIIYLYLTNLKLNISKEKVKNKNHELIQEKLLLRTIINTIPIRVFWKDINGIYLGANLLFLKDGSLNHESDIIGKTDYDMVWINEAEAYRKDDKEVIDSNKPKLHLIEEQTHEDGSKITVDTSKIPLKNVKNETIGIIGIYQDITKQTSLSKELAQLNKDLEKKIEEKTKDLKAEKEKAVKATKVKSEFLANMSHEIRTPMSGIIGMSYLALKTDLNKQQKHYINRINSSANSLLSIINDILDISKIEAGKLEIEKVHFDLFKMIEDVVNLIEVKAYDKGLELIVDYDLNLGTKYYGDSLRISQILLNLLSNAVKFTQEGEILLLIKELDKDHLQFEVNDSGIGMTPTQINKIFESFSQADSSTSRKYGGTGLGLTISKRLVKLMNGKIWLENSSLGIGSKFIFNIELPKVPVIEQFSIFSDKKILLIDDSESWCNIITHQLERFGLEVEYAYSAKEGIKVLREKGDIFDLIFIDWNMPEINGIEAFKLIQSEFNIDCKKNILISAHNRDILNDEIEGSNVNKFLHKPLSPSVLNDTLNEIFLGKIDKIKAKLSNYKYSLQNKIKTLKGSKILLVEDNKVNQEIILEILKDSGIEIDVAMDGFEAITKAENKKYELIFMDIQMPILDGYEATKEIRKYDKEVVIIALTANAMKEDIEKSKDAGMNKHLNKPIEVNKLFETLIEFISKKVDIEEIQEQNTISYNKNKNLPKFKTLDTQYGLNLVMGIESAYMQILKGLIKYKNLDFNSMDKEEFNRMIHTLKGLCASAGALDLSKMAKKIEEKLDKELLSLFVIKLNETIEEIEKNIISNNIEKKDITKEKRDELFTKLKEAVSTKRAKTCKPIIEELDTYNLSEEDTKLFKKIKAFTSKFKFKQALEIF